MEIKANPSLRVLVAIVSYGDKNNAYLDEILESYSYFPWQVDVIVFSNIEKDLGKRAKLIIAQPPTEHPHSFPYLHRQLFKDQVNNYDLFIYSEDDILITQNNIEAFLSISPLLPDQCVPGFLRYEVDQHNQVYMPDIHSTFHWSPHSVEKIHDFVFAQFTNKHSASYILTQASLQLAIASGNYHSQPVPSRYGILESAASDLFENWGCQLKKVICISHIDHFLIHHLPNKYINKLGTMKKEMDLQIESLIQLASNNTGLQTQLFDPETKILFRLFDKTYYPRKTAYESFLKFISPGKRILSIGCVNGNLEKHLLGSGHAVTAIPMDNVIGALARHNSIEVLEPDFDKAATYLKGKKFDCIIFNDVLNHVRNMETVLSLFYENLNDNGLIFAVYINPDYDFLNKKIKQKSFVFPDLHQVKNVFELTYGETADGRHHFDQIGLHLTTPQNVRKSFTKIGLKIKKIIFYNNLGVTHCGIFPNVHERNKDI
jgi:2-polyprenyl-3-methyl-5-hydroxy-6-metoxy-1,4-benzoquinol methylase